MVYKILVYNNMTLSMLFLLSKLHVRWSFILLRFG